MELIFKTFKDPMNLSKIKISKISVKSMALYTLAYILEGHGFLKILCSKCIKFNIDESNFHTQKFRSSLQAN